MKYQQNPNKARVQGFTLIELLVTLAILAILASVAYPSYQSSVRKTHRVEAKGKVLDMAQRMERIRSQTFSYLQGNGINNSDEAERRYAIVAAVVNDTYTITATPLAGTDQANDVCGTMTYTNTGVWTFSTGRTEGECF